MTHPIARLLNLRLVTALFVVGLAATPTVLGSTASAAQDDAQPSAQNDFSRGERAGARSSVAAVKAVGAALDGKYEDAERLARQSADPVAVKLVEWINLRDNWTKAGYERLVGFVAGEPDWPYVPTLQKRAEYLLFAEKAPNEAVERHFARFKPLSPEGHITLARAALARGDKAGARREALAAWLDVDLGTAGRDAVISDLGDLLKRSDHELRLWRLIHAQETDAAVATAGLIGKDYVAAAKCAQALIRVQSSAPKLYRALPATLRNAQAIQYALARYYRKKGSYDEALPILLAAPTSHDKLIDPQAWWIERRLIARLLLGSANRKHWPDAYKLAGAHGYTSGPHFEEGEFLAGWIALRLLDDARTAVRHFSRIAPLATSRTQEARGAYWEGRAWLALGDKAKADAALQRAAQTPTVYYGLLAREALGLGTRPIAINTGKPSDAMKKKVAGDELVRAFKLLADAGGETEMRAFVWALAARFRTADEAAAVAAILARESNPHVTLRFAKAASSYGVDIDDWSYPIRAMPDWKKIGSPVERALVYGLSRQESEFNAKATSHAGARGLMQLMPDTAKLVAKQFRMRYSKSKLTSDPAYNVTLGAAHLGDLVDRFEGSYILTFVGYNAGPGRVREWIAKYGDPRDEKVDPIDWVEQIPFTETRAYVQKVLQNIHVYRSRLDPQNMVSMGADLSRGAAITGTIGGKNASSKSGCGTSGAPSIAALIRDC
jgi:soluble lytic murein transglycosylase